MSLKKLKTNVKKIGMMILGFITILMIGLAMFLVISITSSFTNDNSKISDAISICNKKYLYYKDEKTCKLLLQKDYDIVF